MHTQVCTFRGGFIVRGIAAEQVKVNAGRWMRGGWAMNGRGGGSFDGTTGQER